MSTSRPRRSLLTITALAAAALIALVVVRPRMGNHFWTRGDDLAVVGAWFVAVVAAAWLVVATGACVLALGLGRPHLARFLTPALPSGIRRLVEVAIVAACVALPALPAGAAPPAPSSVPVLADQPVVREPTVPAPTPTFTTAPKGTVAASAPAPARSPQAAAPTPASTNATRVLIRSGDNLWTVARAALSRTSVRVPTDDEVARYWRVVIVANRATLRSGDPSLIFPGEIVTLPPVSVLP